MVAPPAVPDAPPSQASSAHVRGIQAAALLLAASNLLSRILGYGRDWLIGFQFGATGQTDVYQASFTLPDLINYLLAGGALSVSLLPRMAALYAEQDADPAAAQPDAAGLTRADRAFSTIASSMAVAAALLIGVAWLAAEPLVGFWFSGFAPDKVAQTAHLTRIVLPAQLFFLLGGLVQAALLARQRFSAMALTPLLYNGGIITGGLIGGQVGQIEGFSWGALVGAALGGLAVPMWSARRQLRFRFTWQPTDREVRQFLWIAAPLMIGVSLTTVDEWLVKRFGSSLQPGSISWLMTARRVMLVPIGLLGTAAGQAAGTYLARLHAEGQRQELSRILAGSLGAVLGLSAVLAAGLAVSSREVVAMLFQYGNFGARDADMAALALLPLCAAIPAWGAQQVLARAFYATGDTWRPMVATTVVTVAMLPVYAGLASWQGHEITGLCLAGVVGIAVQALVLAILARRQLGLDAGVLLQGIARTLPVATAAAAAVWAGLAVGDAILAVLPQAWPRAVLRAAALVPAGAGWLMALVVVGSAMRMPGMPRQILRLRDRVAGRLRKKVPA